MLSLPQYAGKWRLYWACGSVLLSVSALGLQTQFSQSESLPMQWHQLPPRPSLSLFESLNDLIQRPPVPAYDHWSNQDRLLLADQALSVLQGLPPQDRDRAAARLLQAFQPGSSDFSRLPEALKAKLHVIMQFGISAPHRPDDAMTVAGLAADLASLKAYAEIEPWLADLTKPQRFAVDLEIADAAAGQDDIQRADTALKSASQGLLMGYFSPSSLFALKAAMVRGKLAEALLRQHQPVAAIGLYAASLRPADMPQFIRIGSMVCADKAALAAKDGVAAFAADMMTQLAGEADAEVGLNEGLLLLAHCGDSAGIEDFLAALPVERRAQILLNLANVQSLGEAQALPQSLADIIDRFAGGMADPRLLAASGLRYALLAKALRLPDSDGMSLDGMPLASGQPDLTVTDMSAQLRQQLSQRAEFAFAAAMLLVKRLDSTSGFDQAMRHDARQLRGFVGRELAAADRLADAYRIAPPVVPLTSGPLPDQSGSSDLSSRPSGSFDHSLLVPQSFAPDQDAAALFLANPELWQHPDQRPSWLRQTALGIGIWPWQQLNVIPAGDGSSSDVAADEMPGASARQSDLAPPQDAGFLIEVAQGSLLAGNLESTRDVIQRLEGVLQSQVLAADDLRALQTLIAAAKITYPEDYSLTSGLQAGIINAGALNARMADAQHAPGSSLPLDVRRGRPLAFQHELHTDYPLLVMRAAMAAFPSWFDVNAVLREAADGNYIDALDKAKELQLSPDEAGSLRTVEAFLAGLPAPFSQSMGELPLPLESDLFASAATIAKDRPEMADLARFMVGATALLNHNPNMATAAFATVSASQPNLQSLGSFLLAEYAVHFGDPKQALGLLTSIADAHQKLAILQVAAGLSPDE